MKNIIFIFFALSFFQSFSQEKKRDLKIYLDCDFCDQTYIKQNLHNVSFVRDQNDSDVHLFFIRQRNGSGGSEYEVEFNGKNTFSDLQDKIKFSTNTNMTEDDIRKLIFKNIQLGLVRFWLKQGNIDNLSITIKSPKKDATKTVVKDPWNSWVFQLGARGWFNGQETSKRRNLNFSVSAKRVTEKNKFSFRTGVSNNTSEFSYNNNVIISKNKRKYINISDIISVSDHWSAGAYFNVGTSTFSNKDLYWSFKPAIEYNFFKYSESAKKQLVISYKIGRVHHNYTETTIFNKTKETLWEHNLLLGGSVKQKWGNIFAEVSLEQFLHDMELKEISFFLGTSIRLFKGFSFNINGGYDITNNQIELAAGNVSLEELLLQQQQLKSGYNYFFNVGFSYSFGSIYNTIVNPRFNF